MALVNELAGHSYTHTGVLISILTAVEVTGGFRIVLEASVLGVPLPLGIVGPIPEANPFTFVGGADDLGQAENYIFNTVADAAEARGWLP